MRPVDVVFFYEHIARELDVVCAIAAIARRVHNLSVTLCQWPYGFFRLLGKVKPRLVVLPFCYHERSFYPALLHWPRATYFNFTWEQLFYQGNKNAKTPHGAFSLNHVIHHAWSEEYVKTLQVAGVPPAHILLNGNPAFQLYDKPYRGYFKSRAVLAKTYGLDPDKPWLFFPENYNWAFYSQEMLTRFIISSGSPEMIESLREFCRESFLDVLRWISESKAIRSCELILRPRPSTTLEEMRQFISQSIPTIPNWFHLIQGESVREWIMASDTVVSSTSTSLIETAIAGKPGYMFESRPIPDALIVPWHRFVPRIHTFSEFEALLHGTFARSPDTSLEKWARNLLMSGGDAIRNAAAIIASIVSGQICPPPPPPLEAITPPTRVPLPLLARYSLRRLTLTPRRLRMTPTPELQKDVLTEQELEIRCKNWEQYLFSGHTPPIQA